MKPGFVNTGFLLLCVLSLLGALRSSAQADAIRVPREISADTVAELFIETSGLRVELEITPPDYGAFRKLLPESLSQSRGYGARPLTERAQDFLSNDWDLRADRLPLAGVLGGVRVGNHIPRDPVTGEPLNLEDGSGQEAVFVTLHYPFANPPRQLRLPVPQRATDTEGASPIGFVAYHRGVPINDYGELGRGEVLDLDWTDPWFSQFRAKNLRRQYDSPLHLFVYVEPGGARIEVIVRPKDLQAWIDLGLTGQETLPADSQAALTARAATFLQGHLNLTLDGQPVPLRLDRATFVRRTLKSSQIIEPPQDLNLYAATLAIGFEALTPQSPSVVELVWRLFSPQVEVVRAGVVEESGTRRYRLTPTEPRLRWEREGPEPKGLEPRTVVLPPPTHRRWGWLAGWLAGGLLTSAVLWRLRQRRPYGQRLWGRAMVAVVLLVVMGVTLSFRQMTRVEIKDSASLVEDLLHNVYCATGLRNEVAAYDQLSESVAGDLLAQVYLETRESLELADRGGTRVKVLEVNLQGLERTQPVSAGGVQAFCRWRVRGSVGHWGHVHQRTNRYAGWLTLRPLAGRWKITGLDILREERAR